MMAIVAEVLGIAPATAILRWLCLGYLEKPALMA